MIFKRTKIIKTPASAVSWAQDYMDETRKHKGKDIKEIGMGLGKNYFTSRAPGQLTAHGFIKPRIDRLKLTQRLSENEAILHAIHDHCAEQKAKRRSIFAIRAIVSLDPEKVGKMVGQHIDMDQFLVRATEDTLQTLADRHYPGQELAFFMGIHHDKMTADEAKPREVARGTHNPERLGKPHLHGHLFIFPQTEEGRRLSMSKRSSPHDVATPLQEMLAHCREIFIEKTQSLAIEYNRMATLISSPGWNALIKLAAMQALDDFRNTQELSVPNSRKFMVSRTLFYLMTLDRDHTRRRLKQRQAEIADVTKTMETSSPSRERAFNLNVTAIRDEIILARVRQTIPSHESRMQSIQESLTAYNIAQGSDWRPPEFSFHSLGDTCKATATHPLTEHDYGPDRSADLGLLCRTLNLRRRVNRITMLAWMGDAELKMASANALLGNNTHPEWLQTIEDSLEKILPNQFLLRIAPKTEEEVYPVMVSEEPAPEISPAVP